MSIDTSSVAWMQKLSAKNDGKEYLMLGHVVGKISTLLVTPVGGIGGSMMYCRAHQFTYPIKGACPECRNAVREEPNE